MFTFKLIHNFYLFFPTADSKTSATEIGIDDLELLLRTKQDDGDLGLVKGKRHTIGKLKISLY